MRVSHRETGTNVRVFSKASSMVDLVETGSELRMGRRDRKEVYTTVSRTVSVAVFMRSLTIAVGSSIVNLFVERTLDPRERESVGNDLLT